MHTVQPRNANGKTAARTPTDAPESVSGERAENPAVGVTHLCFDKLRPHTGKNTEFAVDALVVLHTVHPLEDPTSHLMLAVCAEHQQVYHSEHWHQTTCSPDAPSNRRACLLEFYIYRPVVSAHDNCTSTTMLPREDSNERASPFLLQQGVSSAQQQAGKRRAQSSTLQQHGHPHTV